MATSPALDLFTDTERLTVRIDGIDYPLRTSNDLTLDSYKTLERIGPRIGVLFLQQSYSKADLREMSALLDTVTQIAIVAPEEVLRRLGDANRTMIAKVFFELLAPVLQRMRAVMEEESPVPGMKPSLGFNGSTGPRPPVGRRKPPSARSART